MPLEVGSRLGHYDVTALIGEGGMGEVYKATDTRLDRTVAIKGLPEHVAQTKTRHIGGVVLGCIEVPSRVADREEVR